MGDGRHPRRVKWVPGVMGETGVGKDFFKSVGVTFCDIKMVVVLWAGLEY